MSEASVAVDKNVLAVADQIVFERGVLLSRAGDRWEHDSKEGKSRCDLTAVAKHNLRPIVVRFKQRDTTHSFLLPASGHGAVLEMQIQRLVVGGSLPALFSFVDSKYKSGIIPTFYIGSAIIYHCHQLVQRYIDSVSLSTDTAGFDSTTFIATFQFEPYIEFEALVTTIKRAFDTIRFPLFKAFGSGGSVPSNFRRTVSKCSLPPALSGHVKDILQHYDELKKYRDCIQHYAHLGARTPYSKVELLADRYWSMTAPIPDNPEIKSYNKFTFHRGLDGLRNCFSVLLI